MRKLLSLALLVFVALPTLAKDNQPRMKAKAAVDDVYKQWIDAANRKDAEALTNLYDDNAVLMPPREEPVLGKAAIAEWYKKFVADPDFVPFTETLTSNSFHLVGDIAIDTSIFEGDATRNGRHLHFRGKNLLLWKKQKDGSWKIFRYMWDEIPAKK